MVKYAWMETPKPGARWLSWSPESRSTEVQNVLAQDNRYSFLEVSRALDDGSVFFFSDARLTASTRGALLLGAEGLLKQVIDAGISVWIEPMDDKNALRRLRGVTLVPDGALGRELPLSSEAEEESQ